MVRGVNLSDSLKKARLISHEKHKQETEVIKTLLMVSASTGADNTAKLFKQYINMVYGEEDQSKTIEKNRELMEQEWGKTYEVEEIS